MRRIFKLKYNWFDLVFILVSFTLARDELHGLWQLLVFALVGAVVATEHVCVLKDY